MGRPTVLSRMYGGMTKAMGKPAMRPVTRVFSGFHAAMFRLTNGRASNPKWPMLVLTVTGRKTGKPRDVPLVYVDDDGRFADERARLWPRLVQMYPYFEEYQQRTSREIPVVVLTPTR